MRKQNFDEIDTWWIKMLLYRALRYKLFFVKALSKQLRKLTIIWNDYNNYNNWVSLSLTIKFNETNN